MAADELAAEVIRRVEAFEEADRRVAASAHGAFAPFAAALAPAVAASARTGRPTTKKGWRAVALRRAGIDAKAWDPRKGLLANDETVVAVWRRYGQFHLARAELQWAGMANLVGPTFYAGWQDLFCLREADRKARAKLLSRLLDLPENHPLVRAASKSLTTSELKWFETRFLSMQRKIFEDLAWQHEAYLRGGIEEMRRLRAAGQLDEATLENWEDIASGDTERIARGNRALLYREQKHVIQDFSAPEGAGQVGAASRADNDTSVGPGSDLVSLETGSRILADLSSWVARPAELPACASCSRRWLPPGTTRGAP